MGSLDIQLAKTTLIREVNYSYIIASAKEAILGKLRAILKPELRNMYPNVLGILLKVKIIKRRKH